MSYLSGEVGSTTLRHLQDDGGLGIAGSLERGDDGRGGGDVLPAVLAQALLGASVAHRDSPTPHLVWSLDLPKGGNQSRARSEGIRRSELAAAV